MHHLAYLRRQQEGEHPGRLGHADLDAVTPTQHHDNANDPTANQGAALAGTSGSPSASNKYVTDSDPRLAVFGASGASHASGVVPDPGSVAGTTKFLREDATFAVPSPQTDLDALQLASDLAFEAETGGLDSWLT